VLFFQAYASGLQILPAPSMGKGKALRRRAKLVEASTHGNLHKAQKGKASPHLPLPAAPSSKDMVEKLPASLRKMMALKVDIGPIGSDFLGSKPLSAQRAFTSHAGSRREPPSPAQGGTSRKCCCR
jgi:hypothetical protein